MVRYLIIASLVLIGACSDIVVNSPSVVDPVANLNASELASEIRRGSVTSEQAVEAYIARIEAYDDDGPMIQSVIALNPNVLAEARALDNEARTGEFRGPLHGVPVLVKDNIETRELPTTAGSLALVQNDSGQDAPIIARLRQQGAIVLGKTNLSEWANFRSNRSVSGWSGVGGLTRNPHSLDRSACGSSAGSAAAIASFFAPLAIGTETNGSITCPASMTGIVGFKPTVGLLSRSRIVPISPRQDSAGPMARSVHDVALMLSAMAGEDSDDPATAGVDARKHDYVDALNRDIHGIRIGVFRWAEGRNPNVSAAFNKALEVLADRGAVLVDIHEFEPDPVMFQNGDGVLQAEFKEALNTYLSDAAPAVTVRSLSELIAFNDANAGRELALFDQSTLVAAEQSAGTETVEHQANTAAITNAARANGVDKLLADHRVDVLVMPSARPAAPIDIAFTSRPAGGPLGAGWLAAMAGYPALSVPMGDHLGLPLGLMIIGTAWDDAVVLSVGHAYETHASIELMPGFTNGPFEMPGKSELMRPHIVP